MELHFCSRCGISIPQTEIDSGSAVGEGGKSFCAEHRGPHGNVAAVAVADPESAAEHVAAHLDPELLFCANCRVSIPLGDVKSGRAHREFGSLLCAGCSKADPGERAARREAVEAEMAADVDAQDPVVARRCSVCSAAVPYGQIVTGKAKVDGDRVVCERCRAAAVSTPAPSAPTEGASNFGLAAVVLGAIAIGFGATLWWKSHGAAADAKAAETAELKKLRDDVDRKLAAFDGRLSDASRKPESTGEQNFADRTQVEDELSNVKRLVTDLRSDSTKADVDLSQRLAQLDGKIQTISDMMNAMAARGSSAPPPVVPPPPTAGGQEPPTPPKTSGGPVGGGDGAKPAGPAPVNPAVIKLCKELAESADDGVRFNATTELTNLKDPAAIPCLVKALVEDKHYFVRRGCARALSSIKAWMAVPALIKALEDREVYVALMANQALQNITGNDFGVTQDTPAGQRKNKASAAEKWWEKNKDKPPDGVSLHPAAD